MMMNIGNLVKFRETKKPFVVSSIVGNYVLLTQDVMGKKYFTIVDKAKEVRTIEQRILSPFQGEMQFVMDEVLSGDCSIKQLPLDIESIVMA